MAKHIHRTALLLASLTIAACGGGGGGGTSDDSSAAVESTTSASSPVTRSETPTTGIKSLADELVGVWEKCVRDSVAPPRSYTDRFTFTKLSDTSLNYESTSYNHPSYDCSNEGIQEQTFRGTVTLLGSQALVWDPSSNRRVKAERIDVLEEERAFVQVVIVRDQLLQIGERDTQGADGYPTELQSDSFARKQ